MGIDFITLRRRPASLIRRIHNLESEAWPRIRFSNIGLAYRTPSIVDEVIKLRVIPTHCDKFW